MKRLSQNIIQYDDQDLELVKKEAASRVSYKGGWLLRYAEDSQTQVSVVEVGILGEMAYAFHYGIPRDRRVLPNGIGDGGVDLFLDGLKIDVKATDRDTGNLLLKKRPNGSDYLALAIIDKDKCTVRLAGMVSSVKFIETCKTQDFGHGETFFIEQGNLDQILPSQGRLF